MTLKSQVEVTPEAIAEIYAQAAREYPSECCGIIFGAKGTSVADTVQTCVNIQDELHMEDPKMFPRDSTMAFNFDPGDLFRLNKSLRGDTPAKIIYHSHPNVGAYFSETDQAVAAMDGEPSYPVEHIVVDIQKDGPAGWAQFAWDEDSRKYVEVKRHTEVA